MSTWGPKTYSLSLNKIWGIFRKITYSCYLWFGPEGKVTRSRNQILTFEYLIFLLKIFQACLLHYSASFAKFYGNRSMYGKLSRFFIFGAEGPLDRKPMKVKNRNYFKIHAPIYIKFGKKIQNSVKCAIIIQRGDISFDTRLMYRFLWSTVESYCDFSLLEQPTGNP